MAVKLADEMANRMQTWGEVNNMDYVVTVKWGQCGEQTNTYGFDTLEKLEAFRFGVEQSNGWLDYEVEEDD